MRSMTAPSSVSLPMRFSTVTPGKFAVFCRRPVSLLKTVLLPELGLPTSAIVTSLAIVRRSSGMWTVLVLAITRLRLHLKMLSVGAPQRYGAAAE